MYDIMRLNMFKSSTYYPGNFSKQKNLPVFVRKYFMPKIMKMVFIHNADQCELDALMLSSVQD